MHTKSTEGQFHVCDCNSNYEDWFNSNVSVIRQFVLAKTGDPQDADDCTSEAFVRALRHREKFQCRGECVRPWLFTIARNVVADYCKSARYRLEISSGSLRESTDTTPSPEQFVLADAARKALWSQVEALPNDQRRCVELRFLHGLSVDETARAMRRRQDAIRALQYRALRKLKSILISSKAADLWPQVRSEAS